MTTRLWLIRHAAPAIPTNRCYGHTDPRLSRSGRRQAQQIAARLAPEPLIAVYSSMSRRASQTAEAIARVHGLTVQPVEAFAEINFGEFEGLTYEEIESRSPELFAAWMRTPTKVTFPGGEGFDDLYRRVTSTCDVLLQQHRGQTFAIVAHGGVTRAVIAHALGLDPAKVFHLGQRYSAINRIAYVDEFPIVELVNG